MRLCGLLHSVPMNVVSTVGREVQASRVGRRSEFAAEAKRLRSMGLLIAEVAERMGVAPSTVHGWLRDPDGHRQRDRHRRAMRACEGCGGQAFGHLCAKCERERCAALAHALECKRRSSATPVDSATISAALREYHELTGDVTSPGYRKLSPQKGWPSASTISYRQGSWTAALNAAGLGAGHEPYTTTGRLTSEQAVNALVQAALGLELGRSPTLSEYERFRDADGRRMPCLTSVRRRVGTWTAGRSECERVLAELALDEQEAPQLVS